MCKQRIHRLSISLGWGHSDEGTMGEQEGGWWNRVSEGALIVGTSADGGWRGHGRRMEGHGFVDSGRGEGKKILLFYYL